MKAKIITLSLLLPLIIAAKDKQFPEDNRTYIPRVDIGMTKYQAKSLYGANKLVLTFDDGPHLERTPKILDMLKKYNVHATFFVLTSLINDNNLPLIHRMWDEGHMVASHDHDHDDNNGEPLETYRKELRQSISKIETLSDDYGIHQNEMYYRFPYGAYGKNRAYHHLNVMKEVSNELYSDNCINFVFWDIDSADWVPSMTSAEVAQNVRANMEGGRAYSFQRVNGTFQKVPYTIKNPSKGGVILMHDIQAKTLNALEIVLKEAQEKNWQIVPLSSVEEFAYHGKECIFKL